LVAALRASPVALTPTLSRERERVPRSGG